MSGRQMRGGARFGVAFSMVAAGALLSGCIASPTYGTDKTANAQLLEDVTGILTATPKRQPEIAYNPRPELVQPASMEVLPTPQTNVVSGGNSAWPESPEQRLARIRAEATANQDNPAYRAPVTNSAAQQSEDVSMLTPEQQRAEFRRLRGQQSGSDSARRYLSEPPLDYRRPSETAPVGDVGEDEWRKERRVQRAAGKGWSWRDLIPGL